MTDISEMIDNQTIIPQDVLIPETRLFSFMDKYTQNLPMPAKDCINLFEKGILNFSTNLFIVLQIFVTVFSKPQFYLNFTFSDLLNTFSKKASENSTKVNMISLNMVLFFIAHLVYVIVINIFIDVFFITFKWVFLWAFVFVIFSFASNYAKKFKSE